MTRASRRSSRTASRTPGSRRHQERRVPRLVRRSSREGVSEGVADGRIVNEAKMVPRGGFPNRVHAFEDFETDIEKRWWLSGRTAATQVVLEVDREKCAAAGVDLGDLADVIAIALDGAVDKTLAKTGRAALPTGVRFDEAVLLETESTQQGRQDGGDAGPRVCSTCRRALRRTAGRQHARDSRDLDPGLRRSPGRDEDAVHRRRLQPGARSADGQERRTSASATGSRAPTSCACSFTA